MSAVAILGAGAWGTALAVTLSARGHRVTLAVRRPDQLAAMRAAGANTTYLPEVRLPRELELTGEWQNAVGAADYILIAVPSRHARDTLEPIAKAIPVAAAVVSVTKGIEQDSLLTMTRMIAELAPQVRRRAALSGPGFAAEIARGKPAALVAAARDDELAREVQTLFVGGAIRIYRSTDLLGVEIGGAVKNVIAIAAGISDGLGLGSSARAALITRGVAEIMRLTTAAGGRSETIAGLAGLGDLVLTCTGALSRNRRAGLMLAQTGAASPEAPEAPVAEGLANAAAVRALARKLGVEMPIVSAVNRVLYEKASARAMVEELLGRGLRPEFT